MSQKTNKIIVLVMLVLAIILTLWLANLSKIKRGEVSLEKIITPDKIENLKKISSIYPEEKESFTPGKYSFTIYQAQLMRTNSGNTFLVPAPTRQKAVFVSLNEYSQDLQKVLGDNYSFNLKPEKFPVYPIKIDTPTVFSIDYSKQFKELESLNDGTHLVAKAKAKLVPDNYAICLEFSSTFSEIKALSLESVKFIEGNLVCSTELTKLKSSPISLVFTVNKEEVGKLVFAKSYYVPIEELKGVDDKETFEIYKNSNRNILNLGAILIGVVIE